MSKLRQLIEAANRKCEMAWKVYSYNPEKDNELVNTSKAFDCIAAAQAHKRDILEKNPNYTVEIIAESSQKNEAVTKSNYKNIINDLEAVFKKFAGGDLKLEHKKKPNSFDLPLDTCLSVPLKDKAKLEPVKAALKKVIDKYGARKVAHKDDFAYNFGETNKDGIYVGWNWNADRAFLGYAVNPDFDVKYLSEAANIDVKNPGVLEVPDGKKVDELPQSHFEKLVDKKGYAEVIRALTNLEVWNKDKNKSLSSWASNMADKLKKKFRPESAQKSESKVNMSKLKNEIQAAVNKYFKDDKDLLEYVHIDTKKDKLGRDILEVRAELGYNNMVKLADYLDKIITKYDKYAYFDQETSGIMTAVFESAQKNEDTRQWHKLSDITKDDKPFIVIGRKDSSNGYYINVVSSLYDLTNFSNGIWFDLDDKAFNTKEQAYDRAKSSYPKAKIILASKKDFNNTRLRKYTNESAQKNESLRDLNLELADDTNAIAASADKIRQRFEYRTLQNQSYDEKQAEKIYLEVRRELEKAKKMIDACYNKIG